VSRVVVVGSGAREHALAWGLSSVADVVVVPGNAGIAAHGITCSSGDVTALEADLFVIGPELPLVEGLAQRLRAQGKLVLGPNLDGAQLEASKAFMKDFLADAGVPTAAYGTFSEVEPALTFLETMVPPYVIKTDGLAAGKGVLVTNSLDEARDDVRDKLSGSAFGAAGTTVIIEEGLDGEECSLIVLCDGTHLFPLVTAQDFKRVGDGGTGANTGGMGAYAPMPHVSADTVDVIMTSILEPTLAELTRRGIDYRGVLYAGVMLTSRGPKLLEYNVRFGDPETEVLVPLYGESLYELLRAAAAGQLDQVEVTPTGAAVTVVLASHGYPESSRSGDVISGLGHDGQLAAPLENVTVFHAGTARNAEGDFVTNGGRVLAVTAIGDDVASARSLAYRAVAQISFDGCVVRSDIAQLASKGSA
jgi:phosphoribosylamine--glycine ligase